MCQINPVIFAKSRISRTRKIFSRNYPSDYRELLSRRVAFYASRFSNRRGRDGTLLSACFPPPSDTKLFPTSNLPATMHPRAARSATVVAMRSLYRLSLSLVRAELSFSALSRCDNSPHSPSPSPLFPASYLPLLCHSFPSRNYISGKYCTSFKAAVVNIRNNRKEKEMLEMLMQYRLSSL